MIGADIPRMTLHGVRLRTGRNNPEAPTFKCERTKKSIYGRYSVGGLIYLVGLIVVIMAVLSFFGMR